MASCVLILSNSDSGLYDFRKEVLQALLAEEKRVVVSVPDTGYVERLRQLGCEYLPTSFERRGMNPFKDLKLLLFYRRLMKRYRPEAVLTYTIKPNIYGGLAARMTKTPYLVNITGLGTTLEHEGFLQRMIILMYRTAMKKASCVFFQNKGNRDFMQEKGCVTGKCRIIPGSGVNLAEHHAEAYPPQNSSGDGGQVVFLSILRLMNPHVLLPATTALGTIHPQGREMGILSGANVVMPNLSPVSVREKYKLYDNKICTGDEAAECRFCMQRRMESIGYEVVTDRGDYRPAVYNKNTDREA